MKTVMFDMDGVLSDFAKGFTELAHDLFGTPVVTTLEKTRWSWEGISTKEQEDLLWKVIMRTPHWWRSLDPLVSRQTFLRINDLGRKCLIYFVTKRSSDVDNSQEQTYLWLEDHGIFLPTVILVPEFPSKKLIARGISADFSIEDNYENAVEIALYSAKTHSFLINRGYNRGEFYRDDFRVDTVDEFLDAIEAA